MKNEREIICGIAKMNKFIAKVPRRCLFSTPSIPLEEIWAQVHASLKKKQENRLNLPSRNKGKGKILEPGTKVMIYSGVDGKKTYTGKIILDHGVTCLVEKDGVWNRFGTVLAHKSRLRALKDF